MEAGGGYGSPAKGEVSAWIFFAGVVMIIVGCLGAIWGIAAIANDEIVLVGGGHGVMILDISTWGWIQLVLGAVVGLTGFGLLQGNEAARAAGLVLLSLNAVVQVVWFSAAPLWSFLIIILDVVLIYQLCVNWTEE